MFYYSARHLERGNPANIGNEQPSSSRTLLDALATAIDGTDAAETMRLAAEFNDSFGSLVRASIAPESEAGQDDIALLRGFGPAGQVKTKVKHTASNVAKEEVDTVTKNQPEEVAGRPPVEQKRLNDNPKDGQEAVFMSKNGCRGKPGLVGVKKSKKDMGLSSDDSEVTKPKKKKPKRKPAKKSKTSDSSSSSNPSSGSESSTSDSDSSQDSEDSEKAELCYDITDFQSADLPDLPHKWDKGFKRLRSYVPLTLFRTSLLENYYDDEKGQKIKDKLELSKSSLKMQEKQLTYGDFIEMCDLEERYAGEIYGLDT